MIFGSALSKTLLRRVGWLILIWSASVVALGIVALIIRLIMGFFGLSAHPLG